MRVMDSEFQSPLTHGWALSYQREVFSGNVIEVAYIGRRAENLFGAYDVNQAEIFNNGFLDAFNIVKAGGESALMNQLVGPGLASAGDRNGLADGAPPSTPPTCSRTRSARSRARWRSRLQGNRTLSDLSGLGPFFFYPYPQFLGSGSNAALSVIDSEDWSRYHALQVKLERRFRGGIGYLVGYTFAKSMDTRSFDPAFTVVGDRLGPIGVEHAVRHLRSRAELRAVRLRSPARRAGQLRHRTAVRSGQMDRRQHGRGRRSPHRRLGAGRVHDGAERPAATRSTRVRTPSRTSSRRPADCSGCDGSEGSRPRRGRAGLVSARPKSVRPLRFPRPARFRRQRPQRLRQSGSFNLDLALVKRTRIAGSQTFEFRVDATNLTNTPTFGASHRRRDEHHVRTDPQHGHQQLAQGADRAEIQLLKEGFGLLAADYGPRRARRSARPLRAAELQPPVSRLCTRPQPVACSP